MTVTSVQMMCVRVASVKALLKTAPAILELVQQDYAAAQAVPAIPATPAINRVRSVILNTHRMATTTPRPKKIPVMVLANALAPHTHARQSPAKHLFMTVQAPANTTTLETTHPAGAAMSAQAVAASAPTIRRLTPTQSISMA
jgi:hypothetical protein